MPKGVRSQRGNKRMGAWFKTEVPENGYLQPPDIIKIPKEEPYTKVNLPIKITRVEIREISLTYEGNPKNPEEEIITIAGDELFGNPPSKEKMDEGFIYKTKQGELLRILWQKQSAWYESGLIIQVLDAEHTSWYIPNWGNVFAVAIEWETFDGSQQGFNWAKRILGWSERNEKDPEKLNMKYNLYWARVLVGYDYDYYGRYRPIYRWTLVDRGDYYAPKAIRAQAMCGNPQYRSIPILGNQLPIRVYPAIGEVGDALMFGFNLNIHEFINPLYVQPSITPPTTPEDPTQPPVQPPVETAGDYKYFCDGSLNASSVDLQYFNWNDLTKSVMSSQFNHTLTGEFWKDRNIILDMGGSNSDGNFTLSKIGEDDFYRFLFQAMKDARAGKTITANTWDEFKTWATANLPCLTEIQQAMVYSTIKTKVPMIFFAVASGYYQGNVLDKVLSVLMKLPTKFYDWIDFNDIMYEQGIGAFASDIYAEGAPSFLDAFSSYVNFEPQALLYPASAAIGHRPSDYIKPVKGQWGSLTAVDWSSYNVSGFDSTTQKGLVAAEVAVHEIGHTVDYYWRTTHGSLLTQKQDWLDCGGWTSHFGDTSNANGHLQKSKPANQTGGMPVTDTGDEAPVSDYGCMSPMEDFADAFRVYIVNPQFLKDKYPDRYKFMEKYVKPLL